VIKGIHAPSFELLSTWYAQDKDTIYSSGKALDVNRDEAQLLGDIYISDKKNVFFADKLIEHADPVSFKSISDGSNLAMDDQYVYFRENIIEGADSHSFYVINDHHCRDNKSNYTLHHGEWLSSLA